MNAYLFSQGNEFGLLGGMLAAVIVSVVNVGWSTLSGFAARAINRRNLILRLSGLVVIVVWIAFAGSLNLLVAHFRMVSRAVSCGVKPQRPRSRRSSVPRSHLTVSSPGFLPPSPTDLSSCDDEGLAR